MAGKDTSKAPNFYEVAATMSAPGTRGAKAPGTPGASGADATEKAQNVRALLEVFKKMDKLESDPAAKDIIQQMSTLAQKYMDTVTGGPGSGTGKAPGAPASPAPAASGGTGEGGTPSPGVGMGAEPSMPTPA